MYDFEIQTLDFQKDDLTLIHIFVSHEMSKACVMCLKPDSKKFAGKLEFFFNQFFVHFGCVNYFISSVRFEIAKGPY